MVYFEYTQLNNAELLVRLEQIVRLSYLILFVPLGIGLYKYKRLIKEQKLLLLIIIALIVNDGLTFYLREQNQSNLWVYHYYVPIQFCLITVLYRHMLKLIVSGKVMVFIGMIFVLFSLANTLFLQGIEQFNTNAILISNVVFVLFSLLFFYQLLKAPLIEELERLPQFWINLAVLIYYSSSSVLFYMVNHVLKIDTKSLAIVWTVNIGLYVILNCLYSVGLWKVQKQ